MTEYNFFSETEWTDILDKTLEPTQKEIISEENLFLDQLLLVTNGLLTKIKTLSLNNDEQSQKELGEFYILGAQFLYKLRKFITQESIIFHYATYDGEILSEFELDQEDILNNLKFSIEDESIHFDKEVKSLKNVKLSRNRYSNVLPKVLEYASTQKIIDNEKAIEYKVGGIREYTIYKKEKEDMNVLLVMHKGKKHIGTKYYALNGSDNVSGHTDVVALKEFKQYNNGWLYQWAQDYGLGNLVESFKQHPQTPLIDLMQNYKPDRLQGLQGPDLQARQKLIQAKLNNTKLISFKNIQSSLTKIYKALSTYKRINNPKEKNVNALNKRISKVFKDPKKINDKTAIKVNELLSQSMKNIYKSKFDNKLIF